MINASLPAELQSNPVPFHLESLWGVTLIKIDVIDDRY